MQILTKIWLVPKHFRWSNHPLFQILPWFWLIFISIMVLLPANKVTNIVMFDHFDKIIHFLVFFISIMLFSFRYKYTELHKFRLLSTSLFLIVYAVCLEYLQGAFSIGRSFEWADIISNSMGVLVGYRIAFILLQR